MDMDKRQRDADRYARVAVRLHQIAHAMVDGQHYATIWGNAKRKKWQRAQARELYKALHDLDQGVLLTRLVTKKVREMQEREEQFGREPRKVYDEPDLDKLLGSS